MCTLQKFEFNWQLTTMWHNKSVSSLEVSATRNIQKHQPDSTKDLARCDIEFLGNSLFCVRWNSFEVGQNTILAYDAFASCLPNVTP